MTLRTQMGPRPLARTGLLLALAVAPALAQTLAAQSITSGAIRGSVVAPGGEPVAAASVTIESATGGVVSALDTGGDGRFLVALMPVGVYRVLVEKAGYQPVRLTGLVVSGGQATMFIAEIERKPPPIAAVLERAATFVQSGADAVRVVAATETARYDRRFGLSDVSSTLSEFAWPIDGGSGLGAAAQGGLGSQARFVVDGLETVAIHHPGALGLAGSMPGVPRNSLSQVGLIGSPRDVEWRGGTASTISGQTRVGANRTEFRPYLFASSGTIAARPTDNPNDSAATSFAIGGSLSGAIRPDTAHFYLRLDYQSLREPTRAPWYDTTARYQGADAGLAATVRSVADGFGVPLGAQLAPVVRQWRGANGVLATDWQMSSTQAFAVRAALASWDEKAPFLGAEGASSAQTTLAGRDLSAVASLASAGEKFANEARAGVSMARRVWDGPSTPATVLSEPGIGFGGHPTLPGAFRTVQFELADAVQVAAASHRIKVGGAFRLVDYSQTYAFGSVPIAYYSGLDGFADDRGAYFGLQNAPAAVSFTVAEPRLFVQDTWSIAPEVDLIVGITFDAQRFPTDLISANTSWITLSGISNATVPRDRKGAGGRGGFVWNVRNAGTTVVRGGAGLYPDRLDPSVMAEVVTSNGGLGVNRAFGDVGQWPEVDNTTVTASRLTLFSDTYRAPRSFRLDGGLTQAVGTSGSVTFSGLFNHSDFLLRRVDLNRLPRSVANTTEDRPVYATLAKEDALVGPVPGSGRRFAAFDHVFGLAPTGYADYYELTARLDQRLSQGLAFDASYTWSRTRDNVVGRLSPDPADRLSPFPEGIDGVDWTIGTSDLDIPHRVVGRLEYRGSGSTPISLGVRGRWRSGAAFTPGLPLGVDLNGDGAVGNDPAPILASLAGLGAALSSHGCTAGPGPFVARNSCREPSVGALDLHLSVGLPVGGRDGRVQLVVDAFNVVATRQGVIDRALVVIDPLQPLSTDTRGLVVVPLLLNPRFGSPIAGRGEPRLIRIGLRLE